jgi:hypothetical protein
MNILYWLYKHKINKRNQAPIVMRITIDGNRTNFSTSIEVEENQWDSAKQRVKGNSLHKPISLTT